MKLTLLLPAVLLSTSLTSAFGADATNAPANEVRPSALDSDDMTKLVAVRQQVLAAHPDLKTEEEKLKAMHDSMQAANPPPTAEQKNVAFAEWKAYQKQMRAEMLKIDPSLAAVFTRLDESRKHGSPAPFSPASAK